MGAVGTACVVWPLIDTMNPSAEVLALASTEVDLAPIAEGQRVTVTWRGNPVFIDHRTPQQIQQAEAVDVASLTDPQSDAERVEKPAWLVVIGLCTHLACVTPGPQHGQAPADFGGALCPCHGSH